MPPTFQFFYILYKHKNSTQETLFLVLFIKYVVIYFDQCVCNSEILRLVNRQIVSGQKKKKTYWKNKKKKKHYLSDWIVKIVFKDFIIFQRRKIFCIAFLYFLQMIHTIGSTY